MTDHQNTPPLPSQPAAPRTRWGSVLLTTLTLAAVPLMTPLARGADSLLPGLDDTPLDAAHLETMTGRFELPSGVTLMFGLAQSLSVDGVQRWSSEWGMILGDGHLVTSGLAQNITHVGMPATGGPLPGMTNIPAPATGVILQNHLDAANLQQWQTLTVGLGRLGDPARAGLASRVTRLVLPGLP